MWNRRPNGIYRIGAAIAMTMLLVLVLGRIGMASGLWSQLLTVNVTIGSSGEDRECARSLGFWKHQFNGNGAVQFDEADLLGFLATVRSSSGIFDEEFALSGISDALLVLNGRYGGPSGGTGQGHTNGSAPSEGSTAGTGDKKRKKKKDPGTKDGGSARGTGDGSKPSVPSEPGNKDGTKKSDDDKRFDKALAQTLAAWLNFANGAVILTDSIDTTGDGIGDMTFEDLIDQVETILADPDASKAELEHAKDLAEAVNLHGADDPDCDTGTGTGAATESGNGTATGTRTRTKTGTGR